MRREDQAKEIHGKISGLKIDAANQAKSAIQRIQEMSQASSSSKRTMDRELRDFENQMKGLEKVYFDRFSGSHKYLYHGRVKALVEGLREGLPVYGQHGLPDL